MLRTERKTDPARDRTRQNERETRQAEQKQRRDGAGDCARTLEAILAGASWEQLPAERLGALSRILGNSALLELLALREPGPAMQERPLPGGSLGCACTEIAVEGGPALAPEFPGAPASGSLSPLEM